MKIAPRVSLVSACALLGIASAASAFHRQTPPLTVITSSGDTDLPRIPSQGRRLLALNQGSDVVTLLPFTTQDLATPLASGAEPAVSFNGRTVAFAAGGDLLARGLPGSQIVLARDGALDAGVIDMSGTSANPSLDKRGITLVFESAGDLTNLGAPGVANRVYARFKDGTLALVSSGSGWSGNAMIGAKGGLVAFESTSDPSTGVDTGLKQIWVGRLSSLPAQPITSGAGASSDPTVSDDSRLVAFVSQAALATTGADTGVPQVFIYDSKSETYAQITDDPGGCSRPSAAKVHEDWRITFVCGGQAYFQMLRENVRYQVPTPDGATQSILPEMGAHFVTFSTTADMVAGSGTTAGHQIYLLNLFKTPVPSVAGTVTWFPEQGIPGF